MHRSIGTELKGSLLTPPQVTQKILKMHVRKFPREDIHVGSGAHPDPGELDGTAAQLAHRSNIKEAIRVEATENICRARLNRRQQRVEDSSPKDGSRIDCDHLIGCVA